MQVYCHGFKDRASNDIGLDFFHVLAAVKYLLHNFVDIILLQQSQEALCKCHRTTKIEPHHVKTE